MIRVETQHFRNIHAFQHDKVTLASDKAVAMARRRSKRVSESLTGVLKVITTWQWVDASALCSKARDLPGFSFKSRRGVSCSSEVYMWMLCEEVTEPPTEAHTFLGSFDIQVHFINPK